MLTTVSCVFCSLTLCESAARADSAQLQSHVGGNSLTKCLRVCMHTVRKCQFNAYLGEHCTRCDT